ncbi:hypothetical protein [Streptomyces chattanoogensis]|uniref:Uncharacterized protein n=1 Tax=Streptomyces chattanoogensis TaxID=66876 RepID=A0A0N0GWP2_9ACTN|nr:hypothetical protein [Streptomyces chattanoogensis]KPC60252.1 hypothetical protein ADL29_30090 [Streptomyces chattanoogensis]
MPHDRAPDSAPEPRGLSTEDLAQPADRPPDKAPPPTTEAPTLPGESTSVKAESSPSGAEGADADMDTDTAAAEEETPQLLPGEDTDEFRSRWQEIQNRFVDDPQGAVHDADSLVAEVMQTLATTFADHKKGLEEQWNRGEQVDTEGLRLALRHYRSFFNRLLAE